MGSITAKKLLHFSATVFDFDIDIYFIGKRRSDSPFADYFSIYIPNAFYPTLIFQKLTLQYDFFEMFLSFSKRCLQCLYIFSEA